ncbi:helix-turn-helix domain-containing protein [Leclercia sp. EC_58]|uniref:GlxA family transcriptional regulator n=1 Tax=Leclercia sp. EC_58 TaxID=2584090 RepID=UPI001C700A0C|nr:helix-turn-helix domain-containing protein [Leclercia sp. EC_58]MBW9401292.1 helix-turn-helix domain-containing protein [Leclercia sp. EC_58]
MSHTIAILAVPGVQLLDVGGPIDVFAEANRILGRQFYRLYVVCVSGSAVQASSGVRLAADFSLADISELVPDTFLIAGAPGMSGYMPESNVLAGITALCEKSERFGSVCTGALLLALTGKLNGKQVTTHWNCAELLSIRHPEIVVESDALFIADGRVRTAAGVTSGLDLALRLVEEDLGREIAAEVADQLVMFFRRPVNQSHFVRRSQLSLNGRSALQDLQRWAIQNIKEIGSVSMLAQHINLSERHLTRIFRQEIGLTPAQWLERERISKARLLIEKEKLPAKKIAAECGFSGPDVMRRVFSRLTGMTPAAYRKMVSQQEYFPTKVCPKLTE